MIPAITTDGDDTQGLPSLRSTSARVTPGFTNSNAAASRCPSAAMGPDTATAREPASRAITGHIPIGFSSALAPYIAGTLAPVSRR